MRNLKVGETMAERELAACVSLIVYEAEGFAPESAGLRENSDLFEVGAEVEEFDASSAKNE
jgi:hypothetical protein